ncbi:MAG: aldehyde ferredoxin oxidoreductase family protein [Desulfobacteraceae bacterium]|nr:aldehyde ferredoxin oxidoreductase family protein [Desulfobacteraceae bacterium]
MNGFYQRILIIDMTRKHYSIQSVSDDILGTYLGGKGLGSYLLSTLNPIGVDPLSPENHLIFATGPVTGSLIWGSSRYGVFTKSPLTGFYAESYSGGKVPEAMDAAGFDAIVITGSAPNPTAIAISPDHVDFVSAQGLWGADTYETEDRLESLFASLPQTHPQKKGAIVIGPAGENLVRFALIENDYWRSAGRTGVGAVMGSKKLKGILFCGNRKRRFHDVDGIRSFAKEFGSLAKSDKTVLAYKSMGTSMMVKPMNAFNSFPTRYWREGTCEHWQNIDAEALHGRCDVTPKSCLKCFMACGRLTTIREGRHAGLTIEGPEYETIYAFGGLCMIDSIEEIAFLNDVCDRLGMDTITAGNLCAFAMEARKRNVIDYNIGFGDADGVANLLSDIAHRKGVGDLLAQGIIAAAKEWKMEDVAVHVKGMEPAGYDPRVMKGMGLAYAISDRGACHLRTTFYKPELSGMIPADQIENKADLLIDFEDRLTLFDTLILCRFYRDFYNWEVLAQIIRITTGISADKSLLMKIASNVSDLVRRFNIREGLTKADDRLPSHLYRKMEKTGAEIKEADLDRMVQDYYRLRGWDEDGVPRT